MILLIYFAILFSVFMFLNLLSIGIGALATSVCVPRAGHACNTCVW